MLRIARAQFDLSPSGRGDGTALTFHHAARFGFFTTTGAGAQDSRS